MVRRFWERRESSRVLGTWCEREAQGAEESASSGSGRKTARNFRAQILEEPMDRRTTFAPPIVSWRPDGLIAHDSDRSPPVSPSVRKRFLLTQKPPFQDMTQTSFLYGEPTPVSVFTGQGRKTGRPTPRSSVSSTFRKEGSEL